MKEKVLEKTIERYLVNKVESLNGKAFKFNSVNNRAVPDRLCVFPYALLVFVECKAPGKKPTPLQRKVIKYFRERGQLVMVIDSKEQVDLFIENARVELKRRKESHNV